MAKAHKAIYYATSWGDTNGDISSGNLDSMAAGGVNGHTQLWAYNSGHPVYSDLNSNTVVSRANSASPHGIETYWRVRATDDAGTSGKVMGAAWFDDTAWATVATDQQSRANEMSLLGGHGVWYDPEQFAVPSPDGLWSFGNGDAFSGHTGDTTATKKAKVLQRGEELGAALAAGHSSVRCVWYPAHSHLPEMLQDFIYGTGTYGDADYADYTSTAIFPFMLGQAKALAAAGCKFSWMDPYHYDARSSTRAANQMLYGNYSFFASMSRGMVGAYNQTVWAASAPYMHYHPFLFVDGDFFGGGVYTSYSEAQVDTMYGAARDHGCDQRFGVFFLHPKGGGSYAGWELGGSEWTARADNMAAIDVAGSTSGDTAPTITLSTGSLSSGGTLTGRATGRRGVRYVYWTNGSTKLGASMVLMNADTGTAASPATIDLDTLANLRVDWTLTSVPAGGILVAEDVHGQTAQIGTLSTLVGGRPAGTRMLIGRR